MFILFLKFSFCVAIPTGQKFVLHARIAWQPIACSAELETAIASAPRAKAFIKSGAVRNPPVITKVISFASLLSRCLRALANAGIVGTEILSLNNAGAAPVAPPLPSRII